VVQKKVVLLHLEMRRDRQTKDKGNCNDAQRALLDRARNYCALAEQCEDAVRQKLVTWGASPSDSDVIVAALQGEGYLDNERYARAFCESKILTQHWGRQKVLYQLRLKHLPREAVDRGMAAVSNEAYMAVLAEVTEKKRLELEQKTDDPFVLRQKLTASLVNKGFTLPEINQVLTNYPEL
jgi:regulatory protein